MYLISQIIHIVMILLEMSVRIEHIPIRGLIQLIVRHYI